MRVTTSVRPMVLAAGLLASALPSAVQAREPVPIDGKRFVGEVSMIPRNYIGFWRIASRQITSDSLTEIVTMRGPLLIGSCVQVDMVREKVLKIETLRPDEC